MTKITYLSAAITEKNEKIHFRFHKFKVSKQPSSHVYAAPDA